MLSLPNVINTLSLKLEQLVLTTHFIKSVFPAENAIGTIEVKRESCSCWIFWGEFKYEPALRFCCIIYLLSFICRLSIPLGVLGNFMIHPGVAHR